MAQDNPTAYEQNQALIAQRRQQLQAQRDQQKANQTKPGAPLAAPVDPFAGQNLAGRTTPTGIGVTGSNLREQTTPTGIVPTGPNLREQTNPTFASNPLTNQSPFESRFNDNPTIPVPVGHIDLSSTGMPNQDRYNQWLIGKGINPNTIGGAPLIGGGDTGIARQVLPAHIEQQQAAWNMADELARRHGELLASADRALRYERNSERAAQFRDEADKIAPFLGKGVEQTREAYLAEAQPELKAVRNPLNLAAAPNLNALKQRVDQLNAQPQPQQPQQLVQQPTVTAPVAASNQLADELRKRQGIAFNNLPFSTYNLP